MNEQMTDLELKAVLDAAKRGGNGLPGPHEVLDVIDEWRKLDLRGSTSEIISGEFQRLFFQMINVKTSVIIHAPRTFYRIRRFEPRIFHSTDEFWAPQAEIAKKGRCGFDGQPMLYLSEDETIPFEELGIKLHEQVYLVKYSMKTEEQLNLRHPFEPWSVEMGGDAGLSNRIVREFVRAEFTKPVGRDTEFLYNLTASICWFMRTHAQGKADGISYPSIVHGSQHSNIALYPEAQKKLEIEDVRIVELIGREKWSLPGWDGGNCSVSTGITCCVNDRFRGDIKGQSVGWYPCAEQGAC